VARARKSRIAVLPVVPAGAEIQPEDKEAEKCQRRSGGD
jgi:hypothetical protein